MRLFEDLIIPNLMIVLKYSFFVFIICISILSIIYILIDENTKKINKKEKPKQRAMIYKVYPPGIQKEVNDESK